MSILIDREEYITVNVYNNNYYRHNNDSDHLVAITEAFKEKVNYWQLLYKDVPCILAQSVKKAEKAKVMAGRKTMSY